MWKFSKLRIDKLFWFNGNQILWACFFVLRKIEPWRLCMFISTIKGMFFWYFTFWTISRQCLSEHRLDISHISLLTTDLFRCLWENRLIGCLSIGSWASFTLNGSIKAFEIECWEGYGLFCLSQPVHFLLLDSPDELRDFLWSALVNFFFFSSSLANLPNSIRQIKFHRHCDSFLASEWIKIVEGLKDAMYRVCSWKESFGHRCYDSLLLEHVEDSIFENCLRDINSLRRDIVCDDLVTPYLALACSIDQNHLISYVKAPETVKKSLKSYQRLLNQV